MAPPQKKPQVVFVLGGPGAGKGTQCGLIVERKKGWCHISAGDCLREERNNPDSPDGKLINDIIKEGKIVPVEITVKLLKKAMDAAKGKSKFLIDGFPRNLDNVTGWNSVIGESAIVRGVFFFDCSEEVMEKRLLKRGETSGRDDDKIDVIKKRFQTYINDTKPIVDLYDKKGLVKKIEAGPEQEEVWKRVDALVTEVETTPPMKKPKFGKLDKVNPESKSINLMVKVLKDAEKSASGDMVLVADGTASAKLLFPKGAPAFAKAGTSVRVQNAQARVIDGYIHVEVNKWANAAQADGNYEFEPNKLKNISEVQYELVSK